MKKTQILLIICLLFASLELFGKPIKVKIFATTYSLKEGHDWGPTKEPTTINAMILIDIDKMRIGVSTIPTTVYSITSIDPQYVNVYGDKVFPFNCTLNGKPYDIKLIIPEKEGVYIYISDNHILTIYSGEFAELDSVEK